MPRNTAGEHALPSFEDAEPLGARDAEFVQELMGVLDKHGNMDRFGLCLLHEHFPMAQDEVVVETNDPVSRTLTMTVEKADQTAHVKPSQWRFLPEAPPGPPDAFRNGPYEVMIYCAAKPPPHVCAQPPWA